jgi:hypothetical protein
VRLITGYSEALLENAKGELIMKKLISILLAILALAIAGGSSLTSIW